MRKVLEKCPSCGGKLAITRMSCTTCETVILAQYDPCPFCKLSPENLHFLEVFVKNKGNVKEMERELEQSYWNIRSRINELIRELGFEVKLDEAGEETMLPQRREILEKLSRGEITADEAANILSQLKY
jgi:hypothetical protein